MKTFKMFEPSSSNVSENIMADFSRNQDKLLELMEATKDLDVKQIKIAEPIGAAVNL